MQIGVVGLGTMGANLARNAARNGATVAVFNRTPEKTEKLIADHGSEGSFIACKTLKDMVKALDAPRAILLMVKAGDAVDAMIDELTPLLAKGDIIIDAGNSHFNDTARREEALTKKGMHFVGMGVSGGEEGALMGPSMMPGGDKDAYKTLEPLFTKMAADDGNGGKCVSYIGPQGAGHFVKMVHNGIEYGLMQIIAETYHMLKELGKLSNAELADAFATWNTNENLRSFLIEITSKVFLKKEDGKDLVDLILDKAGQKGTGKWTTEAAMNLGVAIPVITAAVDARIISGAKDFRIVRAKEAPFELLDVPSPSKDELIAMAGSVLEAAFCSAFAEGFLLMTNASTEYKWNLNFAEIARIWQGGCIIRSGITRKFGQMFASDKKAHMELRDLFAGERNVQLRKWLSYAIVRGIPQPSISAALNSYDAYRTARLPQNIIQAQRDFFGAHTFERIDKPGTFHADWGA